MAREEALGAGSTVGSVDLEPGPPGHSPGGGHRAAGGCLVIASAGLGGNKRLDGEMPARADGRSRREVRMGLDVAPGNAIARAQVSDQCLGRGDLPGCGGLLVQVADETDADAVLVDLRILGIAAVHSVPLVDPSLRDLDLAILTARAVADHEVVTAAIIAQNLTVLMVDLVVV